MFIFGFHVFCFQKTLRDMIRALFFQPIMIRGAKRFIRLLSCVFLEGDEGTHYQMKYIFKGGGTRE